MSFLSTILGSNLGFGLFSPTPVLCSCALRAVSSLDQGLSSVNGEGDFFFSGIDIYMGRVAVRVHVEVGGQP